MVDDTVVFTVPELQSSLTCGLFIDYAQRTLVEGFTLGSSFDAILSATCQSNFPRHTNLVHVERKDGSKPLKILYYIYTHSLIRPWGHHLPASCPSCKSPRSWARPTDHKGSLSFVCKRKNCKHVCRFPKPKGVVLLGKEISGGRWMSVENLVELALPSL